MGGAKYREPGANFHLFHLEVMEAFQILLPKVRLPRVRSYLFQQLVMWNYSHKTGRFITDFKNVYITWVGQCLAFILADRFSAQACNIKSPNVCTNLYSLSKFDVTCYNVMIIILNIFLVFGIFFMNEVFTCCTWSCGVQCKWQCVMPFWSTWQFFCPFILKWNTNTFIDNCVTISQFIKKNIYESN